MNIRQATSAGEILNCDLTEANGTVLDPNNSNHFLESSVTDFYLRFDVDVSRNVFKSVTKNDIKADARDDAERGIIRSTALSKRRQLEHNDEWKEICKFAFLQ